MSIDRNKIQEAAQKYVAKSQYDKAIAELEKIVRADSQDIRTWLKIGDLHTRRGAVADACGIYSRVADQYASQGFFLKAVAVYKQILKLDGSRLADWMHLAEMYEGLQHTSDALATYEYVANSYAKLNDTEAYLRTLSRMVDLEPQNIPARIKYAEGLSKAGKTGEAADAFLVGARLLRDQGRVEDYIKVGERFLFHRPEDLAVALDLARVYLDRSDARRAIAKLHICFRNRPRDPEVLSLLGRSFTLLDQPLKAIAVYKELAQVYDELGLLLEQERVYEHVLELDPLDADALNALQRLRPLSDSPSFSAEAEPDVIITEDGFEEIEELDADDLVAIESAPPRAIVPPPATPAKPGHAEDDFEEFETTQRRNVNDVLLEVSKAEGRREQSAPNNLTLPAGTEPAPHAELQSRTEESAPQVLILDVEHELEDPDDSVENQAAVAQDAARISSRLLSGPATDRPSFTSTDRPVAATDAPPSATDAPPSATDAPPSATDAPPSATDRPPSATDRPPSATDRPPSATYRPSRPIDARPSSPGRTLEVDDALEEADFLVARGHYPDALSILRDALITHPGQPRLSARLAEIEAEAASSQDQSFAVAERLALESFASQEVVGAEVVNVDEVFAQFKKGVENTVSRQDTATHFDLGIAYKEMGLVDDAVGEFELCTEDSSRKCAALSMIGLCRIDQGQFAAAVTAFRGALAAKECTDREALGLWVELGQALEADSKPSEALREYRRVVEKDPSSAFARSRIEALLAAGIGEPGGRTASEIDRDFDALLGDD